MFIGEVGESIDFIDDATNDFASGELATTSDCDNVAFLGGDNRLVIRAFPSAVVDFVGGCEALVLLSELFADFDTRHGFRCLAKEFV